MSHALMPFVFEDALVRTIQDADGALWFVAKDVALALGYEWNGAARIAHVPEEWRGVTSVVTPSAEQEMLCLSEQGLYFFLARSDKPKALPFQKWLAGEVLPAIRKTGSYASQALSAEERARLEWLPEPLKGTMLRTIAHCVKHQPDRAGELIRTLLDACLCLMPVPGEEPRLVSEFWRAYAELEQAGRDLNHSQNPAHIALNLPEFIAAANEKGYGLERTALLRLLPLSRKYPLIAGSKSTNSRLNGKALKCWVFRKETA